MAKFATAVRKFAAEEEGASLVEYSLLVALIAAASIAVLYGLGQEIQFLFSASNTAIGTANTAITTAS
jgi:pilus assembly protein Flp/PilA